MKKILFYFSMIMVFTVVAFSQNGDRGPTLTDTLQIQNNQIRTIPQYPEVGVFGMLLNIPTPSDTGRGIMIEENQAILYPAIELLRTDEGAIQFTITYRGKREDNENTIRTIFDTIPNPNNSSSRHRLTLEGNKLTLTVITHENVTATVEGTVNWSPNQLYNISYRWLSDSFALYINNNLFGSAELTPSNGHSILALFLGNNRDLNSPADMIFSDLALATQPMAINTSQVNTQLTTDILTPDERIIKMSTGYQRALNPVLDQILRPRNMPEAYYFYAARDNDLAIYESALNNINQITNNPNNPLYIMGIFLRSDIFVNTRRYSEAGDVLEVLTGNKDIGISIAAKVRQALVLFNSGSTDEAVRLFGNIIEEYYEYPEVNEVYFYLGYDSFNRQNYQVALNTLQEIGTSNNPIETTPINQKFLIKVIDGDLAYRANNIGVPVIITTKNGDKETYILKSTVASGMFTGNIMVSLGEAIHEDGILQVLGSNDVITVSYTERLSSDGVNVETSFNIGLATEGKLSAISQTALDIFNEVKRYQQQILINDKWEVIGVLPDSASDYFKNQDNGLVYGYNHQLDRNFVSFVKPGQGIYIEVNDPDCSITTNIDTLTVEVFANSNPNTIITIQLKETGPRTGIFTGVVMTKQGTTAGQVLGVDTNDQVIIRYQDQKTAANSTVSRHDARINIQSMDARLSSGLMLPHYISQIPMFVRYSRVPYNGTVRLQIEDRDMDISDSADKIEANLRRQNGTMIPVTFTETSAHSGVFISDVALGNIGVTAGETLKLIYNDLETISNTAATRELEIRTTVPSDATFQTFRKDVVYPEGTSADARALTRPLTINWIKEDVIVPGNTYRLMITDLDTIPTRAGEFHIQATLSSTNGSSTIVGLAAHNDWESREVIYIGEFFARLGDETDSDRAFFSQTGYTIETRDLRNNFGVMTLPAINVQGRDTVTLSYIETFTADGRRDVTVTKPYRVAMDAEISIFDMKGVELEIIKPGQEFELQIMDSTGDISNDRDTIQAVLNSKTGDKLTVELTETDIHTGIFTGIVKTGYGSSNLTDDILQISFASDFVVNYYNSNTVNGEPRDLRVTIPTVEMGESEGWLLTKIYSDQKFEIETMVRLGESLYAIGAADLSTNPPDEGQPRTNDNLQESARILEQITAKYPSNSYAVESLFLTARIRKEEGANDTAEKIFKQIVNDYPNSEFVPQALYQLTMLYCERQDIDSATETAMQLVYGYPKNGLVPDAFLRIANFYYSKTSFVTAAHVYARLLERFPDYHQAEQVKYRIATCYYYEANGTKSRQYMELACKNFLEFQENYPDHELSDDSLYWAARGYESTDIMNNPQRAYTLYTKLIMTYSNSDVLNYAIRSRDNLKVKYPHMEAESF